MHPLLRQLLASTCFTSAGIAVGFSGFQAAQHGDAKVGERPPHSATVRRIEPLTPTETPSNLMNPGLPSEVESTARWTDGLRMPELGLTPDTRVRRYTRYFTEHPKGKELLSAWLKRGGRYRATILKALHQRGLPESLIAIPYIESGNSPRAQSSAGAAGLWQLMPATARLYGLAVDDELDERRSVTRATEAATGYLADLYDRFGTWDLALAAYNMGHNGLASRVRDLGSNSYAVLSKLNGVLPQEAVLYVPKVLSMALILNNLDYFGIEDAAIDAPLRTSDIDVEANVELAIVARAAGTTLQRLRELNPEIIGDTVPASIGIEFPVHVPASGLSRARAMLPILTSKSHTPNYESDSDAEAFKEAKHDKSAKGAHMVFYRVGDRDTLEKVARSFGVSVEEIVDANALDPNAKLQRGMLLQLHAPESAMSRIASHQAAARLARDENADTIDDQEGAPPLSGPKRRSPLSPTNR